MDNSIEKLNLLDTEYADILTNSSNPQFELEAIQKGLDPEEARVKTRFIMLMKHKPTTPEEWETLLDAWEEACGYRPRVDKLDEFCKVVMGGGKGSN
jgi:hypothetical protein